MAEDDKNKAAKGTKRSIEEQKKAKTAKPKKPSPSDKPSPRWWAPLSW